MGNTFAEPTWGTPQPVEESPSHFSDEAVLFVSINSAFLHVLRLYFASANSIVNPYLQSLIYTGVDPTSPLRIRMFEENPGNEQTPEIQILPLTSAVNLQNTPDLDRAGIRIDFSSEVDDGERRYMDVVNGGIVCRCRADNKMLSYQLSEEVFRVLLFSAPFVADDLGLTVCRPKQADPPKKSPPSGWFSAEVALIWQKEIRWQKKTEALY